MSTTEPDVIDTSKLDEVAIKNRNEVSAETDEGEDKVTLGCSEYFRTTDFSHFAQSMAHSAEEFVRHVWLRGWQIVQHGSLPSWLQDNDFLVRGHRPALNSFLACFKSIFRIHTETGNIWSHLIGCIGFIVFAGFILFQPSDVIQWQEKLMMAAFFFGAILCLGFSCLFHTFSCHSKTIARFFNKLDYAGIAFLTIGSFVPYLYYSFYCCLWMKIFYLVLINALGITAILVSMIEKFATPSYRALRAGVFMGLGLSGVIPCLHYIIIAGFWPAIEHAALGWLALMAFLYLSGATLYAVRVPERLFPGYFDIWFQSHQIFHVFVLTAALVHYHGSTVIANFRLTYGDCSPGNMTFGGANDTVNMHFLNALVSSRT